MVSNSWLHIGALDSQHNSLLLNENCNSLYSIHAIDEFPQNVHMMSDIQKALNKNQSETGGLAGIFEVKLSSKVIGTVCKIATDSHGKVTIRFIENWMTTD